MESSSEIDTARRTKARAEADTPLYNEFFELYNGGEMIPSSDCEAGYLYWGSSRSIGQLGICRGRDRWGNLQFEGWREKLGHDFVFSEVHYDDDPHIGTFRPTVRLEKAPEFIDEDEVLSWLLEQKLDLYRTRIEWLQGMPDRYKQLEAYDWVFEEVNEFLQTLLQVKEEGFSAHPHLTFKQILEKRRTEQTQIQDPTDFTPMG